MSQITAQTKLLGVIGYPIHHSLSPLMHNAALAELGADYVYLAFPIHPTDLTTAIAGLGAIGLVGFNITIPHKQAIMPLLSQITPLAQRVGAVNTVWQTGDGWQGTNTDVAGFIAPLRDLNRDWSEVSAVILGAGGAARAVVVGLGELGCRKIQIIGRNPQKLAEFAASWSQTEFGDRLSVYPWEDLASLLPDTNLLINSTPIGMTPKIDQSPLDETLMQTLPKTAIVYDLIYTPSPTRFLRQAQEQGLVTLDGLEMLVQQGAAALQLWLQSPVPVNTMRQVLISHLYPDRQ